MDAAFESQLMWTTDAAFGEAANKRAAVLDLRPRVTVRRQGARLNVDGTAALDGVVYGQRDHGSRMFPQIDLNARLEAVEQWLFFETAYRAAQTAQDPFGARPERGAAANRLTEGQFRFSPLIERTLSSGLKLVARSDNTWSHAYGGDATAGVGAGYFAKHSLVAEQAPRPFGWGFDAERSQTRYRESSIESLTLDLARLRLLYAPTDEVNVGIRALHERSSFEPDRNSGSFLGGELNWHPSPRTSLAVSAENRSFGRGWHVGFDHRMPMLAWTLGLTRDVDTSPQSLFQLPATDNVAALLDSMFTTRFPDPVERLRVVRDFIAQQGIPTALLQPLGLFTRRLSLVTSRTASVAMAGARNSISLSAYHVRTEDLLDTGPLSGTGPASNNVQYGASLSATHRLTPRTALAFTFDWSRARALRSVGTEESTERGVRVQVNVQAAPKTNAFVGARFRQLDSNVASEGREGAIFGGVDHRF